MKPVFSKVLDELHEEIYLTRVIDRPFFSTEFHFHKECQMNYVVRSSGHRVIGDCIEKFEIGELTFLGSDLPHVWHNDDLPDDSSDHKEGHARSVALFFDPDKLTGLLANFFNISKLEQALKISRRGMMFHGSTKEQLNKLLFKISEEEGVAKLILLLQLLEILCNTNEYTLLASAGYVNTYQTRDNERVDKVFKYIFSNFSSEITLDDVAAVANMNKQAFCRFFKARTQKTLVEFINEIRIAHAIKLMNTDDKNIGSIAYECGYNSISNFNKFFKLVTKKTPSEFKKWLTKSQIP
jgi:AraC-like DNA-binding protein